MPPEREHTQASQIVRLRRDDQEAVYQFLATSPIENVAMMGMLLEEGLPGNGYREFVGYRVGGAWHAIACFSGDISLYATDDAAVDAIADYAMRRVPMIPRIIARKDVVDRYWQTLRRAPLPVQFDRRQLVYTLDPQDLKALPEPRMRLARPDEAEAVARLASAMSNEEIQMDPYRDHPLSYLRLIEHRIRMQRYYVLEEGGRIKFQVHLNSITPYAGQITGVYTPPEFRRQGYAQAGMGAFCRMALERVPKLCLFVNDFNQPAIALYESLGFKPMMEYRAVFMRAAY